MKLNKKGFTLMETLAVIVILGILVAIMYPTVIKLINKNRDENYLKLEESIVSASKLYISDYRYEITINGNSIDKIGTNSIEDGKILINNLVEDGKLKTNDENIIINPKDNGKCLNLNTSYIVVNYDSMKKEYTYDNEPVLNWESKENGDGSINKKCLKDGINDSNETQNANTIITIKKNGSSWSNSGINIALYLGTTLKYGYNLGASSGSRVVWSGVVPGTYNVYASKSSGALASLVDTGVDVIVNSTGKATINYYTLTLNKNAEVASTTGTGIYLNNEQVNINAVTNQGYSFSNWIVESGNKPTSTTTASTTVIMSRATVLTADSMVNELIFNDQSLQSGMYNTAYNKSFTEASNGTGTYTYSLTGVTLNGIEVVANNGKYEGLSLSSRTISGTPSKVGTYVFKIKATDSKSGATKNANVTVIINKKSISPPTNLSVSTAGIVTFTNSEIATGYEISIDNSNWTSFTSGSSYLSTIIAATGSRTVYVRAVNSDTTYYEANSTSVKKEVIVYKITISSNSTTMGTVNTSSYNVINGTTYTTNGTSLTFKGITTGTTQTNLKTVIATPKTGYRFNKWSQENGTINDSKTITAMFSANSLTFNSQTLAAGTYNTTYSQSFTGASNGTGTYTYSITGVTLGGTAVTASSGKYNGLSLSGTTISGTPTKAGTYVFTVKAKDSNSGSTKSANITVVINKKSVTAPTSLSITTAGYVTFSGATNATGYEISIDNSNWTTFTSGSSYLSTIIAATGSRTVYVRAVNSDTTNYASPSGNKTASVTVYKVTISSNNTNYGTVNADSYNVISGATYSTSGATLTFKGIKSGTTTENLKTVTASAKSATGYSTTFSSWSQTSGTINQATTITANFTRTANALTFNAQTLTAGTYNTSYSQSFTGASNGTGTYTYSITGVTLGGTAVTASSGKYNGLGLSGTTISGTPTKAGTYVFAIKAKDSNSGAEKSANMTVVINKKAVTAPTSLSISTAGYVTFSGATNATGYQISIDNSNWTPFTSGSSYLSTIIAATGSRTVYVRAVNSDTTNYASPSSNKTASVTVYKVTINSNNTEYGTVDTASYNVISGATYSTSGATLTFKGIKSGTTTENLKTVKASAKSATGYSTTFSSWSQTSGTINQATTITSNFTRSAKTFTVTFDANGGSVSTPNKTVTYASTYGTLPTPTRTNHEFLGWYTSSSGGSQVTSSTTVSITSAQMLYAHWKVLATPYYVTFTSYPMRDISSDTNHNWVVATYDSYYYLEATRNPDAIAFGNAAGTVDLPTQNCNKVRIKYHSYYDEPLMDRMSINGNAISTSTYPNDTYLYLNVSGSTFTLTASLSNANSDSPMKLWIKEIYFYYE